MKKLLAILLTILLLMGTTSVQRMEAENDAGKYTITIISKDDENKSLTISNVTELPYTIPADTLNGFMQEALYLISNYATFNDISEITSQSSGLVGGSLITPRTIIVHSLTEEPGVEVTVAVGFWAAASYHSRTFSFVVSCIEKEYDIDLETSDLFVITADKKHAVEGEKVKVSIGVLDNSYALDMLYYQPEGGQQVTIEKTEDGYAFDMPAANVRVGASLIAVPEVTAPKGMALKYTGEDQELIEAGNTTGGTLVYSLDGENYSNEIPAAKEPGFYTVWYKVEGNADYAGTDAQMVEASISNVYKVVSGDGTTWERGSSASVTFAFKAAYADEETYSRFSDGGIILVDGKEIRDYESSSGSLIVTLKPSYLETLGTGNHTLKAVFFDGTSDAANFTIKEKASEEKETPSFVVPHTGIE